jgi:hypothetical protein
LERYLLDNNPAKWFYDFGLVKKLPTLEFLPMPKKN